ncbi:MAG: SH3 domain-containing protein [Bacteroidia bacterium]
MKTLSSAFFALSLLLFVSSCGDKSATKEGETSTDSTAKAEMVELWLEVDYDDVRLRENPSMDSKVISTHKKRERLKYLNEMSEKMETVKLQNLEITAPWGKVATDKGQEGWIFLGAVIPAPGKAADEAHAALKAVKGEDCKVMQAGIDAFVNAMKGKSAEEVDLATPELDLWLDSVANHVNNTLMDRPNYDDYSVVDVEGMEVKDADKIRAEMAEWKACGLDIIYPEGMTALVPKPGLTIPALSGMVTPVMKAYMDQRSKEAEEGWSDDGGLVISPKQLAERAVFWNDFTIKHPLFVHSARMRNIADVYTSDLMLGQDNTPSISYETQKLDTEFQAAYDWLLKEHPESAAAKIIREWYDLLKANGLKRTPKVEAFIQKRIEY